MHAQPPADPFIGTRLPSGYRLIRKLRSGGTARIYAATREGAQGPERVAVKILRPDFVAHLELRTLFQREAEIFERIRHPHVMRVLEHGVFGSDIPHPYLVAELLLGLDLADTLSRSKTLQFSRALNIALQSAQALEHAHNASVIHGDIKPENIFLVHAPDGSEVVKLLDFSAASRRGTPGYQAPEIVRGCPLSEASDIFALGVVLYEMLLGRLPPVALGQDAPLGPPGELPRRLGHAGVAELLGHLLAMDPMARPPSMQKVCGALAKLRETTG